MKILIMVFLIISINTNSFAQYVQNNNSGDINLIDVPYKFDSTKLQAANDSFHFLRSFVDYFYLIAKNNSNNLPTIKKLSGTSGWCVGDAHAENFGVLLKQNNGMIFTDNDVDDSGPAPVVYDLFRLMVSSNLYNSNIHLDKIFKSYMAGISNSQIEIPKVIQEMFQKAQQEGFEPSKNKVDGNKIIRTPETLEVNPSELAIIKNAVLNLRANLNSSFNLIDAVQTSKIGGGSGGLLRFELLINTGNNLLHLELKEEVTPSIYPIATGIIPKNDLRIMKSLQLFQGKNISPFYKVYNINGRDMLLRPRFAGNIGVNLDKQTESENEDIINFEAYILGKIHAQSINNSNEWNAQLQSIDFKDLKKDVESMSRLFVKKFNSLKN